MTSVDSLFDDLCASLDEIEARFSGGSAYPPDGETSEPNLRVVERDDENDQTEDKSGKIAALNDRFRQTQPTEDDEIKGEWIMGDDITALAPPTKAAITKKIREFSDFDDCPLHDSGAFIHKSKDKSLPVLWMIRVFEDDSLSAEASHPDDPARSYRAMLVTLSDSTNEEA